MMRKIASLSAILFIPFTSWAGHWSNCMPAPLAEEISQEFRKTDPNGSHGPDYLLPSGQVFSNSGVLCQEGKALSSREWQQAGKDISPSKSVKSFKAISTALEFEKFLTITGVKVGDLKKLSTKVETYLTAEGQKPSLLVGSSKTDAVIILGSAEKNQRLATVMQIKMSVPKRGTSDSDDPQDFMPSFDENYQ